VELSVAAVGKPVFGAHKTLPRGKTQRATQKYWLPLLPRCRILQITGQCVIILSDNYCVALPAATSLCVCVFLAIGEVDTLME